MRDMEEVISFFTVLIVAVVVAGAVSTLYASGLRLWSHGEEMAEGESAHITWRIGGAVCFAACAAIILFALWLMIPLFH